MSTNDRQSTFETRSCMQTRLLTVFLDFNFSKSFDRLLFDGLALTLPFCCFDAFALTMSS